VEKLIFKYFIFINLLTFLIFAFDKYRAKHARSRVREKTLYTLSAVGGFLGASLAMAILRHKTAKSSFLLRQAAIVFLWVAWLLYYFLDLNELNFIR